MSLVSNLFFLLTIAYCRSVVVVDEHRIFFERRENDLDWPLPDNTDPGTLIVHGVHCLEQLQEPIDTNHSNMSVMHRQHCKDIISKILYFFETNPSYNVNEWICKTLMKDRQLRSPGGGAFYCYIKSCNGRKKRSGIQVVKREAQNVVYAKVASSNMGDLLMKNWTDSQSLNSAERTYVQRWEGRSATALGAVGVYCRVKGDLDTIRAILNH